MWPPRKKMMINVGGNRNDSVNATCIAVISFLQLTGINIRSSRDFKAQVRFKSDILGFSSGSSLANVKFKTKTVAKTPR